MAISLAKGMRLGGINEFGTVSTKASGWISEFNLTTKRIEVKRQIPSKKWCLRCKSNDSNQVEKMVEAIPSDSLCEVTRDNFREILTEQDLVETLKNAGNKLVVVQFHSPSCGGCWRLRPKMYQIAEEHPEVIFVNVNFEAHKMLCYNLTVRVLPFFQFYRGTQGRICSFSCTLKTIHKMTNALKKHVNEQSGLEPVEQADEGELLIFASSNWGDNN